MNRRAQRNLELMFVVGLIVLYFCVEIALMHRAQPPGEVQSLKGSLRWRLPQRFAVHRSQESTHLIALGHGGGLVPSGHAAYVFDRSGALVDWTIDDGEDPAFYAQWIVDCEFIEVGAGWFRAWRWLNASDRDE